MIHTITNYVTARDCANLLLGCGASPIMADDPLEAEAVTDMANGLTINLGTLSKSRQEAMKKAGRRANQKNLPVVLDPVGVGASMFRQEAARQLLREVRFTAIRGNLSEMKIIASLLLEDAEVNGEIHNGHGVDAGRTDQIIREELENAVKLAKTMAFRSGAVIVITGSIDVVADAGRAFCIDNGNPMMKKITGAGCQLSALIGAFLGAEVMEWDARKKLTSSAAAAPCHITEAVAAAVCAMGLCGEKAFQRMRKEDGNGSYGIYLLDAMFRLTGEELERGERYVLR